MMKKFLTTKEAADYLGISESEFSDYVDKGALSAYKIGGVYTRFKVDELESYRRKNLTRYTKKYWSDILDNVRDFIYFNDFYILSGILIVVVLYLIFFS